MSCSTQLPHSMTRFVPSLLRQTYRMCVVDSSVHEASYQYNKKFVISATSDNLIEQICSGNCTERDLS